MIGNPALTQVAVSSLARHHQLCQKHFSPKCFSPYTTIKKTLVSDAVPYHWNASNISTSQTTNNVNIITPSTSFHINIQENSPESLATAFTHVSDETDNAEIPNDELFTLDILKNYLETNPTRQRWCWMKKSNSITLNVMEPKLLTTHCQVTINDDLQAQGNLPDETFFFDLHDKLSSINDFIEIQKKVESTAYCIGGDQIKCIPRSPNCTHYVDEALRNPNRCHTLNYMRCAACKSYAKSIEAVQRISSNQNFYSAYEELAHMKTDQKKKVAQVRRLQVAKQNLIIASEDAEKQAHDALKEAFEAALCTLPELQQLVVRNCFKFAEMNSKQRRYDMEWICICLLMRSLSRRLYDRMKQLKLLILPCRNTLDGYVKNIELYFGFRQSVFDCLRYVASTMEDNQKRGVLLADEMSLTESIHFNRQTLEFEGFVNLGDYTTDIEKRQIANHSLVLMFQPFQGDHVKVIGMFLSKGAVKGETLKKLLDEAIQRLGGVGYPVDAVVTDGASWNRKVWTDSGIGFQKFYCKNPFQRPNDPRHPLFEVDDEDLFEKLWFISDFPHLMKTFRNSIMNRDNFWTPDGLVKKSHWRAVIQYENHLKFTLKMAYKLTDAHLAPQGYEKMNVLLAYQVIHLLLKGIHQLREISSHFINFYRIFLNFALK